MSPPPPSSNYLCKCCINFHFDSHKTAALSKADLSRKGSIDERISAVVELINRQADYFTSSSCSGRCVFVADDADLPRRKAGCVWLYSSHECPRSVEARREVERVVTMADGESVSLKFEPFILHVQCRSLEAARRLLASAQQSGCRNSGLTVAKSGRLTVAVRASTIGLEVPIRRRNLLVVPLSLLDVLFDEVERKFEENEKLINRFKENAAHFMI